MVGGADMPDGLDTGWYVRPTLFSDADNDMRIAREEIFGPVLTVISYRDEDEAIQSPTTPSTGWPGSVFTADTDRGYGVAARVRSGTSASTRATPWIRRPIRRRQEQRLRS